jgi:hypothetical protein
MRGTKSATHYLLIDPDTGNTTAHISAAGEKTIYNPFGYFVKIMQSEAAAMQLMRRINRKPCIVAEFLNTIY